MQDPFVKLHDIFVPQHHVPQGRDFLPTEQLKHQGAQETSDYSLYSQPYVVYIPVVHVSENGEMLSERREYFLRAPAPNLALPTAYHMWQKWEKRGRKYPKVGGQGDAERISEAAYMAEFSKAKQSKWKMLCCFAKNERQEPVHTNPIIFTCFTDTSAAYGKLACPEMYVTTSNRIVEAQ